MNINTIDRLPQDDIKRIQDELLSETLAYACEKSPYYRGVFKRCGIMPSDIKGFDEIGMFPLTSREDIQKNNWAFLAVQRQDIREIVSTTGTTGEPVFIALTKNDLERLAQNEEKSFGYTGSGKGDLFHIAVTSDNLFIAGIAYYSGLLRLGASVVRIGPQNIIRHLDLIRRLRPTGIVAVPSFMVQMIRRASGNGISIENLDIKKIVLIGDSIRNPDFSTNPLGSLIEEKFGKICYSTYGITEAQLSFCECQMFSGLHSHPDLILVEIVDDDGNPLPDGEVGELVLTPLRVEGMPLIRYKTGDVTFKISEPCECGRNSVRIGSILGRKHQRLKVKGVTLYPKTIENAILAVKGVVNYQIEAYTGDDKTDDIVLRVGLYNKDNDVQTRLYEMLRAKARVTLKVIIENPEEIEKRLFENGSRKPVTFKDKRVRLYA